MLKIICFLSLSLFLQAMDAPFESERPEMVTKLDLSGKKLTELSILQNYPNLTELDISRNGLRSLKGIEHLTKLQTLDVYHNEYLDEISSLTCLVNLENLDLSYTDHGDVAFLSVLSHLRKLSLSSENVSLHRLKGLTQLKKLIVYG